MSYIVPIGPYHPALEEPVHARLYTDGEEISDAKVFIGYNHRGIEKLCTQKNYIQTLVLVERVCGICSHSHAFSYAMALESIAKMEVPKRGQYIRVIIAELERLHSHYLWLGIALHIIGHDSLFMHTWDDREAIMDILEEITGNRVNYGMITVGGARRDISDETRKHTLEMLDKIEASMIRIKDMLLTDKTVALRTQGVGVLTTEDAIRIGAVGPHARASNLAVDVRIDAPYSSYDDFEFEKAVFPTCDVFARVVVRVLENFESIKIIRQALEMLPKGKINLGTKIPKIPEGEYMVRHEAPRGQLTYKVVSDGGEFNKRVSIHVPTFKNAPTVPTMLKGNSVADAGLIIASIDPCFSCMDR
ncbi:MAG: nickel-dependent hydrogenase large subunit [Lachnospiraceae bacterium]|nr:nickel-dependent hydrogenase large subunit [Lachnospiraceae bacterium]